MKTNRSSIIHILFLIVVTIASLLAFAGIAYADDTIQLQINSMSMDQPQLEFKVTHPDNSTQIQLFQENNVLASVIPQEGSTESTISVTIDSKLHSYTAVAVTNGASVQSAPVVFRGDDYRPSKLTWNFKEDVNIIDGRLETSGTVDGNVTIVYLAINGKIAYRTTPINGRYAFKNVALPKRYNWIQVLARNGWGKTTTKSIEAISFRISHKSKEYIVIDKSELVLFYIKDNVPTDEYPVAIGTPATPTPAGSFTIGKKLVTDAGSDWGARRMMLYTRGKDGVHRHAGYSLHGTNRASSIGKMASHGCIRMFNEDAIMTYDRVPLGFEVIIVS